jgi:hypothetical protein
VNDPIRALLVEVTSCAASWERVSFAEARLSSQRVTLASPFLLLSELISALNNQTAATCHRPAVTKSDAVQALQ